MTLEEKIALGRKYIHGEGCLPDIDRGMELWEGAEEHLTPSDREIYECIRNAVENGTSDSVYYECEGCAASEFSAHTMKISDTAVRASHNSAEVRELFEKIYSSAKTTAQFTKIYNALDKVAAAIERARQGPVEKKEENIRLGNNIGYLATCIGYSIPWFFKRINDIREQKGLKRKASPQGLYMVIGGYNGMDSATKMIIVEIVNSKNLAEDRRILTKEMRVQDLDLPFGEFSKLFKRTPSV